jgi:hypothetical protein
MDRNMATPPRDFLVRVVYLHRSMDNSPASDREKRAMDRHFIHFETPELAKVVNDTAPPPGPEEVLIKVDHAGINRADLLQRLGQGGALFRG